jgi:hypothetical protein
MSLKAKKSDQIYVPWSIQLRPVYEWESLVIIFIWWHHHPFDHLCFHNLYRLSVDTSVQRQNIQGRSDSRRLANLSIFLK